jgi:hypothetical protein
MKAATNRKGHVYHVDGLGTISIVFGIACLGFVIYNVCNVIFS